MKNALTIDLDEPDFISFIEDNEALMGEFSQRFNESVREMMDFLSRHKTRGTFFIQGRAAARNPELVGRLDKEGHRLGVHSYEHIRLEEMSVDDYRYELERAVVAVESVTGKKVLSHRAPSWSIISSTLWALDILEELGIQYDSSIYPMEMQLFGMRGIPSYPFKIKNSRVIEFPPGVVKFSGFAVPFSGGAYLKTLPMSVIRLGYRKLNQDGYPGLLYVHPWESLHGETTEEITLQHLDKISVVMKETLVRLEKLFEEFEYIPLEESLENVESLEVIDIQKYSMIE